MSKSISHAPIPIEIFDILRPAHWQRVKESSKPVSRNRRDRIWVVVSTHFGVAFDPSEMSYFFQRMLGQKEE